MYVGFVILLVGVSLIFSLEPVFGALFAWTLGGEAFVPARAAGGGLIVAAMMAGELSKLDYNPSAARRFFKSFAPR